MWMKQKENLVDKVLILDIFLKRITVFLDVMEGRLLSTGPGM